MDCPSIEESDTKRLSPDVSTELTFSLITSFECKTEKVVLCFFYQMQHFQVHFRNAATTKVAIVQIAQVFFEDVDILGLDLFELKK